MSDEFQKLFDNVREACTPAMWSRGVELARAGVVTAESQDEDEARFRISSRGGMLSRSVVLFPEDGEWECPCTTAGDGCEHAAAAVIVWRRAEESGEEVLQAAAPPGGIGYRFRRDGNALTLERVIVTPEREHSLRSTLAAVAEGRVAGPRFVASQADLAAELALGTHRHGVLARPSVDRVLRAIARCKDVTLDGKPVEVSADPVSPGVRITDHVNGFLLRVEDHPGVQETFSNGVVRCEGALRPLVDSALTGRERHELSRGLHFPAGDAARLVTEVLPDLERRVRVAVDTKHLPDTVREPPRAGVETRAEGDRLSVLASILYGDPPRARISGGSFVHIEGPVPLRDEARERDLIRELRNELGLNPGVRVDFEAEEGVAFAARLERWEGRVEGDGHRSFRLAPPLLPRPRLDAGDFDVAFESVEGSGEEGRAHGTARSSDVLAAWQDGRSLVPLLEGGWAPVPADWLERFGHRLADLLAARKPNGALPACVVPDLARLCDALDEPPPPDLDRLRALVQEHREIPEPRLPADLSAELRSYQREGVAWLGFLREGGMGALLADDMGLGKTLQTLCAVHGRTLVVCPTSVLHNWAEEAQRFRPGLSVHVYHGPQRRLDPSADVTLTTYALLRLDIEALRRENWQTVVLDESQAIKNPQSQVAIAAHSLDAEFRIALTGTPVENRLEELWSQFHFTNRGLLGGLSDFQQRYAGPIADGEDGAAARLRERIRPFLLRRMKGEVARELPPRTEMVLHCELTPAEREVYDSLRLSTLDEVVKKLQQGGNVLAALELLLRLRQASCHTALVPGQEADGSSKVDVLCEFLDNVVAEGHKGLVFSQWTGLLDLVEPHLTRRGIPFLRLDGSTRDRQAVVREFQGADGPPVMLISLRAGGTGLNLTAADHIFLMDPWWNPAVEDQAADRAHRIGQERPVMVYRLVAEGTVEEKILELQQAKRALADAALTGADAATSITRDDLLNLLQ